MEYTAENIAAILSLTKEGKREFLDNLYQFLNSNRLTALDYQRIKILSTAPICPRCRCEYVTKAGVHNGRQVYKCKNCKYQFRETAKSLVYHLHKYPLILDYLKCMLEGKSLRACAREVGISLPTSFRWRHKILSAIQGLEGGINFSGITEADELLLQYSEKGRRYKSPEEKEQAMKTVHPNVAVLVMTDREGNLLFKHTGENKVQNSQIKEELKRRVSENNLICFKPNDEFKQAVMESPSKKVIVRRKTKGLAIYSVNVAEKKITNFLVWMMRFRGVATKYLQNYLMWFVVMNKYLKDKVESDIGRLLNLSSHDRWAWERYWSLIKLRY
ncbi:MAG TPA: IS1595 family transposase [Bacteroidales bacterium]|jgi:transposase-like protein|nr:IS1595 family transposase [Bacteroidales bacterium]HOS19796.1 IS1595 family transposase [Bacteroidales bacterium]HRS70027.1 IS1595 family transposase [Bacteroidales bacterium]